MNLIRDLLRRISAISTACIYHVIYTSCLVVYASSLLLYLKHTPMLTGVAVAQVKADDLAGRVAGLQDEVRTARNEASALRVELAVAKAEALIPTAVSIGDSSTRYCALIFLI